MFTKLSLGGALVLIVALAGGAWALANKKANDCCFPGSDCCYPGSPCCNNCCFPGSDCCYPGSPCCNDNTKAQPDKAKKAGCCGTSNCCLSD